MESTSNASGLERENESGWEAVIGEEVGREKASCVDNAILRRALSLEDEEEDENRLANQFITGFDEARNDDDDGR